MIRWAQNECVKVMNVMSETLHMLEFRQGTTTIIYYFVMFRFIYAVRLRMCEQLCPCGERLMKVRGNTLALDGLPTHLVEATSECVDEKERTWSAKLHCCCWGELDRDVIVPV